MSQHEVPVGGDRRLMVEVSGNRDGMPVFLMHGTPGSRSGPKPRGSVSYRLGVLLISYDRPGYGRSTRHPGRGVADAARDVAAIADALGIDRFAVVGRSGGGPHALACAALLPQRVVRTAVLVSLAPANARDLNWYDGMTPGNVAAYTWADNDYPALKKELTSARRASPSTRRACSRGCAPSWRPPTGGSWTTSRSAGSSRSRTRRRCGTGRSAGSTTSSRSAPTGGSTSAPSRRRCASGTAPTTASRPSATPSGSPGRSPAR
ncbi:alpha/beta fold hydrolase [Luedemannella flava]